MSFDSVLVANRGEIALRILRSAAECGLRGVAVHSEDDARALHVLRADEARALPGAGPRAYLDLEGLLSAAREAGCGAIHPGYGFLAESARLATRCAEAGIAFVGPEPDALELFGDKARARALATRCGVPVLPGTAGSTHLDEARDFLASLGPGGAVMIKAVAGGGGRGMRRVDRADALEAAFARCRSEAESAFGSGELYVEACVDQARHVEVQVLGDGAGGLIALGERECSLQRRHQKLVEWAPSPWLAAALREQLVAAALRLASETRYRSLGTFEFLVRGDDDFAFLEANPRLQVEHTVTEEVLGLDLVALQLGVARGATLGELGLDPAQPPEPAGHAIELRLNMERLGADGSVHPATGTLSAYEMPAGPGVRVDGFGYAGYTPSAAFDSLLAKLVVHAPRGGFEALLARAARALRELRVEGVPTNRALLLALLARPELASGRVYTHFVEDHAGELAQAAARIPAPRTPAVETPGLAARVDASDPLAVLDYGRGDEPAARAAAAPQPLAAPPVSAPPGSVSVPAPLQGTVVSVAVEVGARVAAGAELLVLEAMKMEHVVSAPATGRVAGIAVRPGDTVPEGHPLLFLEEAEGAALATAAEETVDLDAIRPDLAEALERRAFGRDAARAEVVARRHGKGQRTARENVEDLCDPDSFVEYGALAIAAQRRRRELDDLIRRTPADGMLAGIGRVNGELFDDTHSRCAVVSYDYTVLAGTQGFQNHRKKDRIFEIAESQRLPVVLFSEGGGGRPGDVDSPGVAGLDCRAFQFFGRLSGLVPLVGVNSGYCFAGNAALLGCCDVIIATESSAIGMGGPAMIEGGGLGVYRPDEVGPLREQLPNGVVDVAVADEAEAVAVAKRYLAYFQGPLADWDCADQRLLRHAIPENRLRVYDVRRVIETLADTGSVLELRRPFGLGMVTALVRVEGRPLGIVANDPMHLGGAIDPPAADKAARFLQLCDAFDLPVLFLCDTPGFMVGPEVEREANVRHAARLFVVGASLDVPFFTIVLRKGYGLGAQAMAGGSFHAPLFTVAWPTGEFGGMGLEGAVKLGFREELAAQQDPAARRKLFDEMVARMYAIGKAVNMASHFEIDDVIDPAESRAQILAALRAAPPPKPRAGKKRPCVDTW